MKTDDPLIGSTIAGKYRVVQKLGDGGMGSVYKAEHILLKHYVALKILHKHLAGDDEYLTRFQREARTVFKIKHPNVVTLHDFGVEGDSPYLAMEFIEGRSLKEILNSEGLLDVTRVYIITRQILLALGEAHSNAVVHRDLKPDNIMIAEKADGSEFAYILDFGIVKVLQSDVEEDLLQTKTGLVFGSPQYLAPEQVMQKAVDARTDLYSLGAMIFEMLTGELPFQAETALQTMFQHINSEPRSIKETRPDLKISENINKVILKLLAKVPDDRYQSVEECLVDFDAAFDPTGSIRELVGAKPRRGFFWTLVVFVFLVCGLVIFPFVKNSDVANEAALKELEILKAKAHAEIEAKKQEALAASRKASELVEAQKLEAELAAIEAEAQKLEAEKMAKELEKIEAEAREAQQKSLIEAEAKARAAKEKLRREKAQLETLRKKFEEEKKAQEAAVEYSTQEFPEVRQEDLEVEEEKNQLRRLPKQGKRR